MASAPGSELATAIIASAQRLGINPSDLATAISYETGGTFDPWKAGPTTKWGQHRGLIQWGEPQRQKYGVSQGMPVADQMRAAEAYLKDAGVRPGMGLLDVYSAINAGRVGLYNRSDAHNGGAPGTVADKVASMQAHRIRADALLGGQSAPTQLTARSPAPQPRPTQTAQAPSPSQPSGQQPSLENLMALAMQQQPSAGIGLASILNSQPEQPASPPPPPFMPQMPLQLAGLAKLLQNAPPEVRGLIAQG